MAKTQQDNLKSVWGQQPRTPFTAWGEPHRNPLSLSNPLLPTLGKSGKLCFSSQRGRCFPQDCETLDPFRGMDLKRFPRFPQDLLRLLFVLFLVL